MKAFSQINKGPGLYRILRLLSPAFFITHMLLSEYAETFQLDSYKVVQYNNPTEFLLRYCYKFSAEFFLKE